MQFKAKPLNFFEKIVKIFHHKPVIPNLYSLVAHYWDLKIFAAHLTHTYINFFSSGFHHFSFKTFWPQPEISNFEILLGILQTKRNWNYKAKGFLLTGWESLS